MDFWIPINSSNSQGWKFNCIDGTYMDPHGCIWDPEDGWLICRSDAWSLRVDDVLGRTWHFEY